MTIKEAATKVLKEAGQPLSVDEIYARICSQELFRFGASQPKAVLSRRLRIHCEGIQAKVGDGEKCFRLSPDGKFSLL